MLALSSSHTLTHIVMMHNPSQSCIWVGIRKIMVKKNKTLKHNKTNTCSCKNKMEATKKQKTTKKQANNRKETIRKQTRHTMTSKMNKSRQSALYICVLFLFCVFSVFLVVLLFLCGDSVAPHLYFPVEKAGKKHKRIQQK